MTLIDKDVVMKGKAVRIAEQYRYQLAEDYHVDGPLNPETEFNASADGQPLGTGISLEKLVEQLKNS